METKENITKPRNDYEIIRTESIYPIFEGQDAKIIVLNFDLNHENEMLENSLGTAAVHNFDPEIIPPYTLPECLSAPIIKHIPHAEGALMQCVTNFLYKPSLYRESSSAILKIFLLATDYDIAEIAWRCGFCTDAYFIKSFHKATGTPPYTYRKALLRNEL